MSGQVVASARATFMDGRSRWEASKCERIMTKVYTQAS